MILDEGCAERGCPMHDSRETKGVVFIRKEWVGLTAEDFSAIKFPAEMRFPAEFRAGARWADVKLKEKNT